MKKNKLKKNKLKEDKLKEENKSVEPQEQKVSLQKDPAEQRRKKDNQIKIEELVLILLLMVVVGVLIYWQRQLSVQLEEARRVISVMDSQIVSYREKEVESAQQMAEQQEKIQLLSDTLSSKSEQLSAYQDSERDSHIPGGYPIRGMASILEGLVEDITGDGADGPDDAEGQPEEMAGNAEDMPGEDGQPEGEAPAEQDPNVLFEVFEGTCITATGAGRVTSVLIEEDGTTTVTIDHENGYQSFYNGTGMVFVKEGDSVSLGAVLMSITEDASVFEYKIMYEEKFIDPKDIIRING